ncbi:Uncharacterised protein [Chlamydia trachomatis]|nr:Uncharacterised protein [Chlamydia trachomatis]
MVVKCKVYDPIGTVNSGCGHSSYLGDGICAGSMGSDRLGSRKSSSWYWPHHPIPGHYHHKKDH